jgi:hypothetical protein
MSPIVAKPANGGQRRVCKRAGHLFQKVSPACNGETFGKNHQRPANGSETSRMDNSPHITNKPMHSITQSLFGNVFDLKP